MTYEEQLKKLQDLPTYHLVWEARCEDMTEEEYLQELKAHCTEEGETWILEEGYEGVEDELKAQVRKLVALAGVARATSPPGILAARA